MLTLSLGYNSLTEIPDEVDQLEQLITLDLSHNQLAHIAVDFADLEALEALNLAYNPQLTDTLLHVLRLVVDHVVEPSFFLQPGALLRTTSNTNHPAAFDPRDLKARVAL